MAAAVFLAGYTPLLPPWYIRHKKVNSYLHTGLYIEFYDELNILLYTEF